MRTALCTCPLCEAMCGLEVSVEGDRLVDIRGDRSDPLSAGFICPKAMALGDLLGDPDRLRTPRIKENGRRRPAEWAEAIDFAASRLAAIQKRYGADSVAFYTGNPNLHSYAAQLTELEFGAALGSRNLFSTASTDHLPHLFAAYQMFGHQLLLPLPDLDRTDCLLIFGANPAESNGSLMAAPGMPRRLREIQVRGGRVFVFDPRRTRTAALADRHFPIRPGSDALLLLALVNTLFAENLADPGRLAAFTDGIDALRGASAPFLPERVSSRVGIAPADIRGIARKFAASPAGVCYGRVGVCTQEFGAACQWLINAMNILTGNLDRTGGAMFPKPAVDIVRVGTVLGQRGSYARWHSRVRKLPEFAGQLPVAALAEEIETPGRGKVRALITSAGNPVLSTPNGGRLDAALSHVDFMVSIDFYLNETTRHADVILPPTCALERDHYDVVFRAFGVRNTARYTHAVVDGGAGTLHDWQIYCRLGARICAHRGGLRHSLRRMRLQAVERITPRSILGILLRAGPHRLHVETLESEAHTRDLGPLTPCLPGRLGTPKKRIQLAPQVFEAAVRRLELQLDTRLAPDVLTLIGRRQLRSNNSWMHRFSRLEGANNRCTLLIHPDDARARGLVSGELAEVRSRTGKVVAEVEISQTMSRGVVSLPHGYGAVSANQLTDDLCLDELTGTAALNGIAVVVEPRGCPVAVSEFVENAMQIDPEGKCPHF